MASREILNRIGYEAAEVDIPYEQFEAGLSDWKLYPVWVRHKLAGIIYHAGPELHACILPEFRKRWFSRRIVRELLIPMLTEHGRLLTAVTDDKPWGHAFVRKFGFHKMGRSQNFTVYELENLKWQ